MNTIRCPKELCWGRLKEIGAFGKKFLVGCNSCNTVWKLEQTSLIRGEPVTFNEAIRMKREGKIQERNT